MVRIYPRKAPVTSAAARIRATAVCRKRTGGVRKRHAYPSRFSFPIASSTAASFSAFVLPLKADAINLFMAAFVSFGMDLNQQDEQTPASPSRMEWRTLPQSGLEHLSCRTASLAPEGGGKRNTNPNPSAVT